MSDEPDLPTDVFPLDELVEHVADRLAALDLRQPNGQVATVPDARTLRYYTSLGLVDRPVGVRNRKAQYTERHVDQAVRIKVRQAGGATLAEIQAAGDTTETGVAPTPTRTDRRFWARPTEPTAHPVAVRITDGATLVLDPDPDLDPDAIRAAARDLIRLLDDAAAKEHP